MRRVTFGMMLAAGSLASGCQYLIGIKEWDAGETASSSASAGGGGAGGAASSASTSTSDSTTTTSGTGGGPPVGPCGPIPQSGLFVCWTYSTASVPANEYVGLAGGEADPDQGQTIQNQFLDPMCVNPTPGESFVLCYLGTPDTNWDIQFRAGLHAAAGTGTIAGTWDCSDMSCAGDVYVYQDGIVIGSLIADVSAGAVSTLPHFNPPGLLNVKVSVP